MQSGRYFPVSTREDRLRLIEQIVAERAIRSQAELQQQLAELGEEVTQATLSRDLRDLGVVKAPEGYRTLDQNGFAETPLVRAVRQFVTSAEPVGQLVILRTGPGQAQLVAARLDEDPPPHAAGTIAGDDTIFIAARTPKGAVEIADRLAHAAGLAERVRR